MFTKQKRQRTPVTESSVENTKEIFHLGFSVAPIIGAILTTLMGKDIHLLVELIVIVIVILINSYILWLRSKTEEDKELSLFYTFWTNKILPNQSGDKQAYNVEVAIIEDEGASYFREAVRNKFKTEVNLEKLKNLLANPKFKNAILKDQKIEQLVVDEFKDHDLYFRPIRVGPPTKEDGEELQAGFKKKLDNDLDHAAAVIVVRTGELEAKPWVYNAIISWAYQHSEVPILFAQDPDKKWPDNELAKKFLWIPDDPKSLPWRLLQRAKSRARVWRVQATYNRAMVWNIVYISLMCLYIGAIWIKTKNQEHSALFKSQGEAHSALIKQKEGELTGQKNKYKISMAGMDEAVKTEKGYRAYISKQGDSTLSVSYWYGHKGKPYVFTTTENPHITTSLENNYGSIIGCGFSQPNHVVEGKVKRLGKDKAEVMEVTAYDNYDKVVPMAMCQMKKLRTSAIKSIVCATFNDDTVHLPTNRTVGVCAFTEDEHNDIFGETNRAFLVKRAKELHTDFIGFLETNNVASLADRKEKTQP